MTFPVAVELVLPEPNSLWSVDVLIQQDQVLVTSCFGYSFDCLASRDALDSIGSAKAVRHERDRDLARCGCVE